MRMLTRSVAGLAGALALGWGVAWGQSPAEEAPGRYLVQLQKGVSPMEVAAAHGLAPDVVFSAALNGFAGTVPPGRLRALEGDPRVARVEPDRVVELGPPVGKVQVRDAASATAVETLPTGIDRIDADLNPRADASAVGIAIIDTGIALTHPELNVAGNVSFVRGTKKGNDDNGHGTHVAGTAAARANNSLGVRGVAPNARLFAVKVLDRNGSGLLSWIVKGVDWVTQNAASKGIQVANMSLGFTGSSATLDAAISNSVAAGVTYVVAAGNSGVDAAGFSPANHPAVITVSALADSDGKCGGHGAATPYGADDTLASFSNFGPTVELAAPGVNILSTWLSGGYATISGTSMASPHVAGAAAQYLASHPGTAPADVRAALLAAGVPQGTACTPATDGGPDPALDDGGFGGFTGDKDTSPEPVAYAKSL